MFTRIRNFCKDEAVLCIAALAALATMLLIPPDGAYLAYIDLRVLCLLLCLMAVVEGFQSCSAFRFLAFYLLKHSAGGRVLGFILVMLPFFSAMLVTNDVALLTFVPFTLALLERIDCRRAAVPLLVLQTVAANLGSMATPVGNPQNLFLYSAYDLSAGEFFSAKSCQNIFPIQNRLVIGAGQGIGTYAGNGSADGEDMDFFHSLFFPLFKSALAGGFVEQNSRGTGDIEGIDFAQHRDIHFQISLFHPEVGQAGLFRSDYHCYRLGEVDIGVFEVSMRSCSKYLYSAFAQIIHR